MNEQSPSDPRMAAYLVLGQELMRHAYSDDSPEEIQEWVHRQLDMLAGKVNENARMMWEESFEFYDKLMAKRAIDVEIPESERKVLTWPWVSWSSLIDPLEPGMLAVLAAGDGMGKTIAAECIAEHWAEHGHAVAFLHFELNRSLMLDRRTVRHTAIPRRILREGKLSMSDTATRMIADNRLKGFRGGITYVHTPGWTMERALIELGGMRAGGLCDVFVIDYLEKARPAPRQAKLYGTNVFAREADDVEQIKTFAEQHELPALLLAQLNKIGKGQAFDQLDRTAIRGAGEKTEKANVVIMLHRDNPESAEVKVRIDKNTIGPTGSFNQTMEASRFRIVDIANDPRATT